MGMGTLPVLASLAGDSSIRRRGREAGRASGGGGAIQRPALAQNSSVCLPLQRFSFGWLSISSDYLFSVFYPNLIGLFL